MSARYDYEIVQFYVNIVYVGLLRLPGWNIHVHLFSVMTSIKFFKVFWGIRLPIIDHAILDLMKSNLRNDGSHGLQNNHLLSLGYPMPSYFWTVV